ncbi:hypothetical protein CsSME_00030922 [Camellia sinensis var. sinensis]
MVLIEYLPSDMAMAALDALISIGGKVVEFLVEPVGCQFSYVHRMEYIEDLRDQVEKLEAQRREKMWTTSLIQQKRIEKKF